MPRMWYCWNVIVHGALSRTCLRWPLRRFKRELAYLITLYNMKLSEDIAVHSCECPLLESLMQGVWRSCNLTSFSPCLTGPVDYLFASRHKGPGFKSLGGYLCETRILLLALSHYIGDPDGIDHCGLVWHGPHPKPSLGPRTDNVTISLDLTHLSCLSFTLAAGLPTRFTTKGVGCWGGALWRACNLTSFSLVQWPTRLLPVTRDLVQIPWGVLMWNQDSPVSVVSLQVHIKHCCFFSL
jgi:hypothetical protein